MQWVQYVRLDAPIPVEFFKPWMLVEESTVPTAHMPVADHPTFSNTDGTKIFEAIQESSFVYPVRERPMLFWYDFVVALSRCEILRGGLLLRQGC